MSTEVSEEQFLPGYQEHLQVVHDIVEESEKLKEDYYRYITVYNGLYAFLEELGSYIRQVYVDIADPREKDKWVLYIPRTLDSGREHPSVGLPSERNYLDQSISSFRSKYDGVPVSVLKSVYKTNLKYVHDYLNHFTGVVEEMHELEKRYHREHRNLLFTLGKTNPPIDEYDQAVILKDIPNSLFESVTI